MCMQLRCASHFTHFTLIFGTNIFLLFSLYKPRKRVGKFEIIVTNSNIHTFCTFSKNIISFHLFWMQRKWMHLMAPKYPSVHFYSISVLHFAIVNGKLYWNYIMLSKWSYNFKFSSKTKQEEMWHVSQIDQWSVDNPFSDTMQG